MSRNDVGVTTLDEEVELGRMLMSRYPGKAPYEALRLAFKDMQHETSGGKLGKITEKPMADFGEVDYADPLNPRSFDVNLDSGMNTTKLPPGYDRNEWKLGVGAHEVLGHGGDLAYYGDSFKDLRSAKGKKHFVESPYKSLHQDSIRWLINKTKGRFNDIDEAKSLGLPYMLPENRKGEK
jgi:hypothetical protein